jgi:hypothetical protein
MGNTPTQLKFIFIDTKRVASQLLVDAENIDSYLTRCQRDPVNANARRRQSYAANTVSSNDASHYQSILDKTIPLLPMRLRMDLHTIPVVSLMPSADGGMPHTRPYSIICVPQLEQINSLSTMIHELWHVHQRKYKDTWGKVFEQLGWKEWTGRLPEFLRKHCRINPDTIDSPFWVYQDTWVPVPIFRDISLPSMSDVDIWFYHIKGGHHVKQIPSEMEVVGLPKSAYEHPREMTAYLLADHALYRDSPVLQSLLSSVGHLAISSS